MLRRIAATVSALVLIGGAIVAGTAAPVFASTCGPGVPSDFNGDGVADAAIWDSAAVGIRVLYGTRSGLTVKAAGTALGNQLLPWSDVYPETYSAPPLAVGDFNGDGCADLAIGNPRALVGPYAGTVEMYYGSSTGLVDSGHAVYAEQVIGYTISTDDRFGSSLAVGDINGDGVADLVVGASGHSNGKGEVFVFPGSRQYYLGSVGGSVYHEGDGIVPGLAEKGDEFGAALAVGDFNGDGYGDLAVGVPGEDSAKGAVFVMRGSGAGLTGTAAKEWTQGTAGILGNRTAGDSFGAALATGSFRGNGFSDLAIGVPDEGVSGVVDAGALNVIYSGGTGGLSSTGNQLWTQGSAGLGTATQTDAYFGSVLAVGDYNGDQRGDLTVGIPDEPYQGQAQAGAIEVLPGSTGGLTATGSQHWSQASPGVPGTPEFPDRFGDALLPLRLTSATHDDLLFSVSGEETNANSDYEFDGQVNTLTGGGSGLTTAGMQEFDDLTSGLVCCNNYFGDFGLTLA